MDKLFSILALAKIFLQLNFFNYAICKTLHSPGLEQLLKKQEKG
tara:strand:+ start:141 stop:272 length:132 start_codon:yes stop_codon:yes gene_type:complete